MTPPSPISNISPSEIVLTPEEKRINELYQMAKHGNYAPGITAKDLVGAKRKVYKEIIYFQEDDYEPWPKGGDTVLHDAARSGHYPPGTTLQMMAETKDAELTIPLTIALMMYRDHGIPLPACCNGLALAMYNPYCGHTSLLHYIYFCGYSTPDTTPELLVTTNYDGWTALHAAAQGGNLIQGITIRMLKNMVTPVNYPGLPNHSALAAFKEHLDQALRWIAEGKSPLKKLTLESTQNLLRASVASAPNLGSDDEVREFAELFKQIAPVQTVLWIKAELLAKTARRQ